MISGLFSLNKDNLQAFGQLNDSKVTNNSRYTYQEKYIQNKYTGFKIRYQAHQLINISCSQAAERYQIITWARIDNLKNLAELLGTSYAELCKISSAEVILKCYLKWKEDCVHYLIGDWVFALFDEQTQTFFLAKDHFGNSCFYYYHEKDFIIFSSDIKNILSFDKVPKQLNPNAIFQQTSLRKKDSQTCYKGIFQVPNGHFLIGSESKIRLKNYWLPINAPSIYYKKNEDYTLHFLELYQQAVDCRMNQGKTGIALSSGLDSSSVAALAAPILANRNEVMETFTWKPKTTDSVLMSRNSFGDETILAKQLVNHLGTYKMNIAEEKMGNILDIKRQCVEVFHQPIHINIHFYELLERVQQSSIHTLLTGNMGNYTISYQGDEALYFKNFWTRLYKKESIQELQHWKNNKQLNNFLFLAKSIYRPFVQPILKRLNKDSKKPFTSFYSDNIFRQTTVKKELANFSMLTPDIEMLRRSLKYPKQNIVSIFQSNIYGRSKPIYNHFGINTTAPPMDKRIIEFCIGLPNSQFIGEGYTKRIFKKAMHGKIPNQILYNQKRGRQQGGLLDKYRYEAKEIKEVLHQFEKSPLVDYWLDTKKLMNMLHIISGQHSKNTTGLFSYITTLSMGLTIGLFLQQFEQKYG